MENKDNKCTVTVFVLATNETEALEETISQIYAHDTVWFGRKGGQNIINKIKYLN